MRIVRVATLSIAMATFSYCDCHDSKGPGSLTACAHVAKVFSDLQTFEQNHPINGAKDPISQVTVLGDMINELEAAINADPEDSVKQAAEAAKNDAEQMQNAISTGVPVTSAALINDVTAFGNACSGHSSPSSGIVTP